MKRGGSMTKKRGGGTLLNEQEWMVSGGDDNSGREKEQKKRGVGGDLMVQGFMCDFRVEKECSRLIKGEMSDVVMETVRESD